MATLNRIAALLSIVLWLPTAGCLRTSIPEVSEGAGAAAASSELNSESPPAALDALRGHDRALILLSVRSAERGRIRRFKVPPGIFAMSTMTMAVTGLGQVKRVAWNHRADSGLQYLEPGRFTRFVDYRESARADDYHSTDPETRRTFWVVVQEGGIGDPPSVVEAIALDG